MIECSCHRMKCDRGADSWNKFEEITNLCFSYQCWATCTAKDKHGGSLKVGETNFLFTKMSVSTWLKEFRTTQISMCVCGMAIYVPFIPRPLQRCATLVSGLSFFEPWQLDSVLPRLHLVTSQLTRTRRHSEDKDVAAYGSQSERKRKVAAWGQACLVKRHVCRLVSFFNIDWLAHWHVI